MCCHPTNGLPTMCCQFFLYDVFKSALHVTASDLTLFYDALGASAVGDLLK